MKTATGIDATFDNLLHDVFSRARQDKRRCISVERVLAELVDSPQIVGLLRTQLSPDALNALRDELQVLLLAESAAERTARAPIERRWTYRLKAGTKSLLRQCLPYGVKPLDLWLDDGPLPSADFKRVLVAALARVMRVRDVQSTDFFLSIIDHTDGAAHALLQRHGISRYGLVCFLSHGGLARPVYSPSDFSSDAVRFSLLNDDYTPMLFVVEVLETLFSMPADEARSVMMAIHKHGRADCGSFSVAIACEKNRQLEELAFARQHPLRASLEAI